MIYSGGLNGQTKIATQFRLSGWNEAVKERMGNGGISIGKWRCKMEAIGYISSIATLISFAIYFIGKFIKIKISQKLRYENIEVYYTPDDVSNLNLQIVDEYDIGPINSEKLIVSSEVPINWIKMYECEFDDKKHNLKKGRLVAKHGFLRAGHAIQFNTYLACGIPSYMLEFERYDYLRGRFDVAENGKNGVLCASMSHTFRSYLYYIFE